ncbi:hypothetical protein G9A89_002411 [Geosiphon pyriformis]|nr:hypothetical protein G9A89_002411 [Geosiphon pyriformis]
MSEIMAHCLKNYRTLLENVSNFIELKLCIYSSSIRNSRLAGSIITYQLMQQLGRNVDKPVQTVIVIADGMKKTPVGEINNFSFTINGITIPVKVLVMDVPQYQALIKNDWLLKTNTNLDWET